MTSTISTTTTITVAIMLLLTTHPLAWLGPRQAPLSKAAVSPRYQVEKHYDDYDNYSGYSETDGVSRHLYLLPSLLSAENAPTNTQDSAKAGIPRPVPDVWNIRPGGALAGGTCISYGVGLSAIRAAAARNGVDDLNLFAVLADDLVPDVDNAIVTGVGALQAGVVRLYGVVILGGWVRWCARLLCAAHGVPTS